MSLMSFVVYDCYLLYVSKIRGEDKVKSKKSGTIYGVGGWDLLHKRRLENCVLEVQSPNFLFLILLYLLVLLILDLNLSVFN